MTFDHQQNDTQQSTTRIQRFCGQHRTRHYAMVVPISSPSAGSGAVAVEVLRKATGTFHGEKELHRNNEVYTLYMTTMLKKCTHLHQHPFRNVLEEVALDEVTARVTPLVISLHGRLRLEVLLLPQQPVAQQVVHVHHLQDTGHCTLSVTRLPLCPYNTHGANTCSPTLDGYVT